MKAEIYFNLKFDISDSNSLARCGSATGFMIRARVYSQNPSSRCREREVGYLGFFDSLMGHTKCTLPALQPEMRTVGFRPDRIPDGPSIGGHPGERAHTLVHLRHLPLGFVGIASRPTSNSNKSWTLRSPYSDYFFDSKQGSCFDICNAIPTPAWTRLTCKRMKTKARAFVSLQCPFAPTAMARRRQSRTSHTTMPVALLFLQRSDEFFDLQCLFRQHFAQIPRRAGARLQV